ncbi:MAG: hypothetical protein R2876_05315 [Eubacteriales bacterium]
MKEMGKQDAQMFFSIDKVGEFAEKISSGTIVIEERKFYSLTDLNSKIKLVTKFKMVFSDVFKMVKMIHLRIK